MSEKVKCDLFCYSSKDKKPNLVGYGIWVSIPRMGEWVEVDGKPMLVDYVIWSIESEFPKLYLFDRQKEEKIGVNGDKTKVSG